MLTEMPLLYSFRRCPYAMRARLALFSSGIQVILREVVLRDKPPEMIAVSPKATVPVLVLKDGTVLDESLDIISWCLAINDREGLLEFSSNELDEMRQLIETSDGPFKNSLDRYKYPNRYDDIDPIAERERGSEFICSLNERLGNTSFLFGNRMSLADIAILPFVRQFAHVDRDWFWSNNWPQVIRWLETFLESDRFKRIMTKYPQWKSGDREVMFGE